MHLSSAPEMTTAVTDGLFGLLALFLAWKLSGGMLSLRTKIWRLVLVAIGASAVLGVPAHMIYEIAGINPPNLHAQTLYWAFLGAVLFCMASVLAVAVMYDITGGKNFKKTAHIFTALGILFYALYFAAAVLNLIAGYFIVFIAYSGLIMLFALGTYTVFAVKRKKTEYVLACFAVLAAIAGNLIQASRAVSFTCVWQFDYNSVYHFIMMVSTLLFYAGVRIGEKKS
jgi:hypothetical protein